MGEGVPEAGFLQEAAADQLADFFPGFFMGEEESGNKEEDNQDDGKVGGLGGDEKGADFVVLKDIGINGG